MRNSLVFFAALLLLSSCSQRYYIVRHAEKASATDRDPALSEAGKQRALALKDELKTKKIGYIFSTNTIRTRTTAEPTAQYFTITIENSPSFPDSSFISKLKKLKKNTLVVGHSNTVDDIVNKLCGSIQIPADLPETAYANLFIVKKKGKKFSFTKKLYGQH